MRIVRLAAAIVPLVTALVLVAVPAQGSFPGRNGDIVFSTTVHDRQWLVFLSPAGTERRRVQIPAGAFGGFSASPDGAHLAYAQVVNRHDTVMVADLELRHPRRITSSYGGEVTWSPDGRHLTFIDRGVWVVGVDGRGRRQLTTGRGDEFPVWSRDGRTIVFRRDLRLPRGSPCTIRSDLYTVRVAGGRARRLFRPPIRCGESFVEDWSPGGRMLLVGITDSSGQWAPADPLVARVAGLSVLRTDGSRLRRVLTDGNVVWSPDGRRIAFTGSQCPAAAPPKVSLCTANPDGRAIRRIASVPFGSGPMTWLVRRR